MQHFLKNQACSILALPEAGDSSAVQVVPGPVTMALPVSLVLAMELSTRHETTALVHARVELKSPSWISDQDL